MSRSSTPILIVFAAIARYDNDKKAMAGVVEPEKRMGEYSDSAQKMMAAMGWKKGESLGKHRQGVSSFVKVQKRQDGVGLGLDRTEQYLRNKGSGKASFDDPGSPWWTDAYSSALAKVNGGEKASGSSLDEIYKATGGARLGMRARLYQGAKLRRTEQSSSGLSSDASTSSDKKKKRSRPSSSPPPVQTKEYSQRKDASSASDEKKSKKKKKRKKSEKESSSSN